MARLELNNEVYANLFLMHVECVKVFTRTCAIFATRSDRAIPSHDTVIDNLNI